MSSDTSETDFLIPSPTIPDEEEVDLFSSIFDDDEEDSTLNVVVSQLSMLISYLVTIIANSTAIWLVPFLIMAWTYRWMAIHYVRALIFDGDVIPIIREDKLWDQQGKLVVARAVRLLELAMNKPNVSILVLVLDSSMSDQEDISSYHELAVYLKNISRSKEIRVVSFLRDRVGTADYILALAASTVMVDHTTRLQMDVSAGVQSILKEGSRTMEIGSLDMIGSELVEAGLADEVGNYMDFLINNVGAVIVPVEGPQGWEITGFAT